MSKPTPHNRQTRVFGTVRRMALAAMMVATSVIIGTLCKNFLNFAGGLFRITFENLPVILSGIFLGPIAGGLVGAASDLVSYFLSPQAYPPNLIVTLGAFSVGLISGLMARFAIRRRGTAQIALSGAVAHLIGSVIIKSIGLFSYYGWAILWRVPLYLVIATLEIILICLLWQRKSIRRLLEGL